MVRSRLPSQCRLFRIGYKLDFLLVVERFTGERYDVTFLQEWSTLDPSQNRENGHLVNRNIWSPFRPKVTPDSWITAKLLKYAIHNCVVYFVVLIVPFHSLRHFCLFSHKPTANYLTAVIHLYSNVTTHDRQLCSMIMRIKGISAAADTGSVRYNKEFCENQSMWAERSGKISRSSLSSIYGTPAHAPFPFRRPPAPLRSAHLTFSPAPLHSRAGFKGGGGQDHRPPQSPTNRWPPTNHWFFLFLAWFLLHNARCVFRSKWTSCCNRVVSSLCNIKSS